MLTTTSLTTTSDQAEKAYKDEIGRIIRMPYDVDKLHAIAALWLSHPIHGQGNRQQMVACGLAAKEQRDTRANKFGSSLDKNSGLRSLFAPPAGLLEAVEAFAYDSFFSGEEGRRNWHTFRRAFPEFATSEVL